MFTDPVSFIFCIVLVVLTIIIGVVGIYAVIVMAEFRKTLQKVNATIDMADEKIATISAPIENLANLVSYFQSGLKVFDAVTKWTSSRSAATDVTVATTAGRSKK